MEVVNNRLKVGDKVKPFVQTGSYGGALKPDSIIIHYTAGPDAKGDGSQTVGFLKGAKVSAHMVVGANGSVTQMVDFNRKAYHAGKSAYGNKVGYNSYAIGIEICNPGSLTKKGDGYVTWWNEKKTKPIYVPADKIYEGKHRNYPKTPMMFWHKFTQEQIDTVFEICETLCKTFEIEEILGHEEIAPGRKSDPGPAFPLDKLRDTFIKKIEITCWAASKYIKKDTSDSYGNGFIDAKTLNLRASDSTTADILLKGHKGKRVNIIEEKGDWYQIKVEKTGSV